MAHSSALIAIGRNEGARLIACLEAARAQTGRMIYVDSGSTDGSVEAAKRLGADVVSLDLSTPFTAARARNEGFARLIELEPSCAFVQFLDGDCVLQPGWLDVAEAFLVANPQAGIACGRRREKFPDASSYNKLCDLEWDTPVGQTRSCGGDALIRVEALKAIGGYNGDVIAGEEPEMCVRLRAAGWTVHRLDHDMTLHDAAMTRFSQWWRRNYRAGHAYAEGFARHGGPPDFHNKSAVRSNWLYGLLIPAHVIALTLVLLIGSWFWPWQASAGLAVYAWAPLGLYALLTYKVFKHRRARGTPAGDALLYARFVTLGKIPQALGQLKYFRNRRRGVRAKIIEYKG